MIKNFSRIAIFTFIALFFLLVTPAFAKTVTLDELGKVVDETVDYEPDYIYVIGNYVFTQDWELSTQDVMLAARSIQMNKEYDGEDKDTALGEMTIYQLNRELIDYEPTGKWLVSENLVGSSKLDEDAKLNIRYIDYNFIQEDTKINVDLNKADEGNYKTTLEGEPFNFSGVNTENSVNLSLNNGMLTGLIKRNSNEVGGFTGTDKTGYYFAFVIEVPNATNETTVEIQGNNTTNATLSDFDVREAGKEGLAVLWALDPTSNNKTITITVDLDGGGKEYAPTVQTIDWSQVEFQKESFSENVKFNILSSDDLVEGLDEKKELEGYGFDFDTIKGTEKSNNGEIRGVIKQQKLKDGTFQNDTGYFVPIKIEFPKEEYPDYANKWVLILNTEDGNTKTYTPSEKEREQGWVLVLFRLNENAREDEKVIKYSIDFDGAYNEEEHTGEDFIPFEYKIDYKTLVFETESKVTFEYFDETTGEIKTKEEKIYQNEKIDEALAPELGTYTYHKFDYWYKSGSPEEKFDFSSYITGKDENVTLKAHWTIDADKFINDIVEELSKTVDYKDVFEVSKEGNTITFDIKDTTTKLSEMDNTSIPGAIAYILQRGEVTGITLSAGNKQVEFTKDGENNVVQTVSLDEEGTALKEKIQAGAKALFEDILGGSQKAQDMTLNKMAVDDQEFTLTIGALDDSVKLTEGAETKYTFDFATDFTTVKNEEELNAALKNAKVTRIDIAGDFEVTKNVEINSNVIINGGESKHTISIGSDVETESIFTVKNNANVTINNINLKGNEKIKKYIFVENGSLNATGLVIDATTVTEGLESAIEVGANSKLTISELTFDKETYKSPAVKANKENATINLTDKDSKMAARIEKENITVGTTESDSKVKDDDYQYYNYYNNENNSKIYETVFYCYEAGARLNFTRYNYYGEKIKVPPTDNGFKKFGDFTYDAHIYKVIGYTTDSRKSVFTEDQLKDVDIESGNVPDGVIKADDLTATSDNHYWVSFKVTIEGNARKVNNNEEFMAALEDPDVHKIFIVAGKTVDLTSEEDITIDKQLTIIGENKVTSVLKAKNIKITSGDVYIQRLNIQMEPTEGTESLIEASNDAKLILWDLYLRNTGSSVKSAIKYVETKTPVDVRWVYFYNEGGTKITNTYIDVQGALAEGTEIFGNTFKKINEEDNKKKSAITIKTFDTSATMKDEETDVRFAANDCDEGMYFIKILKDASNSHADIAYESRLNYEIAVEYDEDHKNFHDIEFYIRGKETITPKYVNSEGTETTELDSEQGIQVIKNIDN